MGRCFLSGFAGDQVHAMLCGVGLNLRKVLKKLAQLLWPQEKWRNLAAFLVVLCTNKARGFKQDISGIRAAA
jgi:IS5 family transposase